MKLFILGAGGMARETFCHIRDISPAAEIRFIDDVTATTEVEIRGEVVPVVKSWDDVRALQASGFTQFTIGVGAPVHKKTFLEKALAIGLRPAPTWVHPKALVQDAKLGVGGLIAPNVTVTCGVIIKDYVILGIGVTIGHDAFIGDFTSCNPGAVISGNVILQEGCLVGAGAVIREKLEVAAGVTIGAQSCVVKNISEREVVYAGIPARKLR